MYFLLFSNKVDAERDGKKASGAIQQASSAVPREEKTQGRMKTKSVYYYSPITRISLFMNSHSLKQLS